jgi:hypothetical protein
MATVSKDIAETIAMADGYYALDPRVHRIVEYTDMGGKKAYGLEYEWQVGKYEASEFVQNPRVYWQAEPE